MTAEALKNEGNTKLQAGDIAGAEAAYRAATTADPYLSAAWNNLGNVLHMTGRTEEAVEAYKTALSHQPHYTSAISGLANTLVSCGKPHDALEQAERAVELSPNSAQAQNLLGFVLHCLHREAVAHEALENAVKLDPAYAEAWNNLGNVCQALGLLNDAESAYEKATSLKPDYAKAWRNLSTVHRFSENEVPTLKAQYDTAQGEAKMHLGFAFAKACYDTKNHADMFPALESANASKRSLISYQTAETDARFEKIISTFDSAFFEAHSALEATQSTPVFVIGAPRSGTTLTEQILASHSHVFGAGEVDFLHQGAGNNWLEKTWDKPSLVKLRARYLIEMGELMDGTGITHITDKLPANAEYLGLIALLFPSAKVIWCKRDLVDTGFSIYRQFFTGAQDYAYDQAEIGHYLRGYRRLMQHWQSVLPLPIHMVEYEALVQQPEAEIKALIKAAGLEWEEACLNFHTSKRAVKTASAAQVRQALYTTGMKQWEPFKEELSPLIKALG